MGRTIERATQEERARLGETFVTLCEIESPTGRERGMLEWLRGALAGTAFELSEDDTSAETGADCGNLLARFPAPAGARTVMMCAHIDTVPLEDAIEVELSAGIYRNRRDAILGADNKAAVAILVELARRVARDGSPVGVELLFTTSEETGLRGAKAFDVKQLEADIGYAFDHASPIGELIVAAPTYYHVRAEFTGRASHAGIRPEDGRNAIVAASKAVAAIEVGRIDEQTTTNVGRIEGGTATNVVAEHCVVEAEARSLDDDKASARMHEMVDTLNWAASEADVDLDTTVEQQFRAYKIAESAPVVQVASAALRDCGIEPVLRPTGGGSDANAFQTKGFSCLNVANATEANHTPDESVSAQALEQMFDVTLRILANASKS